MLNEWLCYSLVIIRNIFWVWFWVLINICINVVNCGLIVINNMSIVVVLSWLSKEEKRLIGKTISSVMHKSFLRYCDFFVPIGTKQ